MLWQLFACRRIESRLCRSACTSKKGMVMEMNIDYNEQEILTHLQQRLSSKRYHHSLCVAERAVFLAHRYGADENRARFCGLTHDICKNLPEEEMLRLIEADGILLEREVLASPQLWHAIAGSCYIRRAYGIADPEILNAVRYHTTGRANMSLLEEVVYLADLTSSDRSYPDVEDTRALADRSLRGGMLYSLRYILSSLLTKGQPLCRDSVEAYNYYCQAPLKDEKRLISSNRDDGEARKA